MGKLDKTSSHLMISKIRQCVVHMAMSVVYVCPNRSHLKAANIDV